MPKVVLFGVVGRRADPHDVGRVDRGATRRGEARNAQVGIRPARGRTRYGRAAARTGLGGDGSRRDPLVTLPLRLGGNAGRQHQAERNGGNETQHVWSSPAWRGWSTKWGDGRRETAVKCSIRNIDAHAPVNGNALSLPFRDGEFDAVVMQHVTMQISEKDGLFAELARVVAPGGCLALHEIFAGEGEIHYPLAWATEPDISALETLDTCRDRLSRLGFAVSDFEDRNEPGTPLSPREHCRL